MCDYSLQTVKSRPAKVGEKLTTQSLQYRYDGFAAPEDIDDGGLRSSGNRACLRHSGKVQRTRVVWVESESGQSHDGHLSASQQGQPVHPS